MLVEEMGSDTISTRWDLGISDNAISALTCDQQMVGIHPEDTSPLIGNNCARYSLQHYSTLHDVYLQIFRNNLWENLTSLVFPFTHVYNPPDTMSVGHQPTPSNSGILTKCPAV